MRNKKQISSQHEKETKIDHIDDFEVAETDVRVTLADWPHAFFLPHEHTFAHSLSTLHECFQSLESSLPLCMLLHATRLLIRIQCTPNYL